MPSLSKCPGSLNWQPTNLNVTPKTTEQFALPSTPSVKETKEWRKAFQELAKGGRLFWKLHGTLNVVFTTSELEPVSISYSIFPFWFEHYSWKKKIEKAFKILKWSITCIKTDYSELVYIIVYIISRISIQN